MGYPFYTGLGGTGGINGGAYPPWATPPFNPNASVPFPQLPFPQSRTASRGVPMGGPAPTSGGRFPRLTSIANRFAQPFMNGSPGFDLGLGLLAASRPQPQGTSSFGSHLAEASSFAQQRQTERQRQEQIQRELQQIEQQRQMAANLIRSLATTSQKGQQPRLTKEQADFLSTAAQIDPRGAMSMMGQIPGLLSPVAAPEITEAGRKARELREAGHELTDSQELELYGLGADATDDELDELLSTSDLESYRLPDGSKLPPGSTVRDAMEKGALPYTAAEITQQRAAESGATTLQMLEDMALGKNGVFIDAGGGPVTDTVPGRLTRGMANATGTFFGTDASRQRDLYNRTRKAYIASLARSRGETGSLSDADIERISLALPELGAVPMTEDQARSMFAEARKIYGSGNTKPNAGRSSGAGGVRFLGYE